MAASPRTAADYVVRLAGGEATPHPWINVIANERFGCHISAEGAGFTWSRNSRDFQLTPWSNDPVVNRPGEALYVADLDGGDVCSPFAAFCSDPNRLFEARHGLGHSTFSSDAADLRLSLTQTVDRDDPVKLSHLEVTNSGGQDQAAAHLRLRRMGPRHGQVEVGTLHRFHDEFRERPVGPQPLQHGLLRPPGVHGVQPARLVIHGGSPRLHRHDRRRADARDGVLRAPLSGSTAIDGDPCAALAVDLTLAPGQTEEILFLLGDAGSETEADDLARKHRGTVQAEALRAAEDRWNAFTGALHVKTPDPSLDDLVNGWLPYQSLSCRLLARSGFYQASGAYGFRDQLQDTLAYMVHDPDLARRQILNAAARQFEAGDVQHWWLPGTGAGVRTMIADDVVWLAYALDEYCRATGDDAILDEQLPFISGPALEPGQHDAFFQPEPSSATASVYEHAARALDLAIERTGPNGLPLFLGGDWNDGMNRVGEGGKGESVWLGWFLLRALKAFSHYAEARGDSGRSARWEAHATKLKAALEGPAWDGGYYRRGFFDDGTALGSASADECQIDSIAQSWCVLSGEYDGDRAKSAMDAVLSELVDAETGIIRLFAPPFEKTARDPGYIKAYPPGVRENGGQYTHAATWVVCALAALGRGDDAYDCFSKLNPVAHATDREAADHYRVEPYVVAADVYSQATLCGSRRLDLVHRLCRLALSFCRRGHPGHPDPRRQAGRRPRSAGALAGFQGDGAACRERSRDRRGEAGGRPVACSNRRRGDHRSRRTSAARSGGGGRPQDAVGLGLRHLAPRGSLQ